MDTLDIYYRAFKDYRKHTLRATNCEKDRNALAASNEEDDKLEATKYLVTIEEDWIKAIEDGLKYVEQAVGEERQFIRTNGDVVPIEKVRKISKDSVVHLAKHSDMITHVPDEPTSTVVPDNLYMVEKLSDYAVYENRFLYMMLCYIKNFIEYRLEKIDSLRHSYVGDFYINKEIVTKKRTLRIETTVFEERSDNPYPIPDSECAARIKRMSDCREIINSLLNTDLMQQVAKTPMIKPPIVKTNVLKMNNNFKNALALYDYIAGYKGNGYSYEEVKFTFSPYTENFADEVAESANLLSFLAYKTGNKIEDLLETAYQEEEARRKIEEEQKLVQRLARLKKRAAESNKTLEEYMLVLEERNRQLEKASEELAQVRMQLEALLRTIEEMKAEKAELARRINELQDIIEEKEEEIAALKQKYIEDMAALKKEYENKLATQAAEHTAEVEKINAEFAEKFTSTVNGYEAQVGSLNGQLAQLQTDYQTAVADCDRRIAEMQFLMGDYENEKKRLTDALDARLQQMEQQCAYNIQQMDAQCNAKMQQMEQKCSDDIKKEEVRLESERARFAQDAEKLKGQLAFIQGELDGIRIQQGKMTPSHEYTSRERFIELEAEYEAFQEFFKKQWELTKKEIRKTILWSKNEKKKPVND